MEFETVQQILIDCVNQVVSQDAYLLQHDISERAISHRLAVYLTPQFSGFDVDCEYNGNIEADSGRKYIRILQSKAQELGLQALNGDDGETSYRCVYPDIIVHKRGRNGPKNNLLVIEIKKSSSAIDGDWDAEKLTRFTSSMNDNSFNYQFGSFVEFNVGETNGFKVKWYKKGKMFHSQDG